MHRHGLVVIVSPEFQIFRGIPGWMDWRCHGHLSHFVMSGVYRGETDELLLVGEPMGPGIGTVLFVGKSLPPGGQTPKALEADLASWLQSRQNAWKKLNIDNLRWGLSEEWERYVDSWRRVFDNKEYVDVERLVRLEKEAFFAGLKDQPVSHQI